MNTEREYAELCHAQGEGQPIPSESVSAPPWEAEAAPCGMGFGQRLVVALLLTVVLVPPLGGFYSSFSGIPLRVLLWGKQEKGTLASSASRGTSVDVKSKKNDLLDALVRLEQNQKILDEAEKHADAVSQVVVFDAIRAVERDRDAIDWAMSNLKRWDVPQDEIDRLYAEAKKISADRNAWFKTPEGRWVKTNNPADSAHPTTSSPAHPEHQK